MDKKRLYSVIAIACLTGYGWLYYNLTHNSTQEGVTACMIKRVTGIPCPSCGSTRSVIYMLQGNFAKALYMNPIGVLMAGLLICLPLWITYDIVTRKTTCIHAYRTTETYLKKTTFALPLIGLLLLNWIWNFYKDL